MPKNFRHIYTFHHYSRFSDLISSIVIDIKELLWYQKSAARTRDKVGAVSLYPHVPGSTKSFPHRDVTLLSVSNFYSTSSLSSFSDSTYGIIRLRLFALQLALCPQLQREGRGGKRKGNGEKGTRVDKGVRGLLVSLFGN